MRNHRVSFFALLLVLAIPSSAWAQGGPSNCKARYNPSTEVTVAGTITDVQLHPGRGAGTGTHLILTTNSGNYEVHVGPTAYIEKQQFAFAKGDQIQVIGSSAIISGTETLLARQINKAGKTLSLRDVNGIPLWSRRGGAGN